MLQLSKQPAFELGQTVGVGRFLRRGPQRKRLQTRARVPVLERPPHTRWRQAPALTASTGVYCL
jgi:hypothetical protein